MISTKFMQVKLPIEARVLDTVEFVGVAQCLELNRRSFWSSVGLLQLVSNKAPLVLAQALRLHVLLSSYQKRRCLSSGPYFRHAKLANHTRPPRLGRAPRLNTPTNQVIDPYGHARGAALTFFCPHPLGGLLFIL